MVSTTRIMLRISFQNWNDRHRQVAMLTDGPPSNVKACTLYIEVSMPRIEKAITRIARENFVLFCVVVNVNKAKLNFNSSIFNFSRSTLTIRTTEIKLSQSFRQVDLSESMQSC